VATYQDKIAAFRQRINDIAAQLIALKDRRREFAIDVADQKQAAIQALKDLDYTRDNLVKEEQTLQSAIEQATTLQRDQEQQKRQDAEHQRQVDAYNHSKALVALSLEIDDALAHLRQLFERRASLLDGLARTQVCDPLFTTRLANKGVLTGAACFANLHAFLDLTACAPGSRRPLADTNELLLNVGQPPSDDKGRVKFQ
jgi:chorismate mutase